MTPRCDHCGALVSEDAEWCGQCYAPRGAPADPDDRRPDPEIEAPGPPEVEPDASRAGAGWTCPTCGTENDLSAEACAACGTPFGRLLEEPHPGPRVDPARARRLSLLLPGLGHLAAGRRAEGLARIVALAWVLGALLIVVLVGGGRASFLAVVYGLAAVALYAVTALDAERVATERPQLLSPRALAAGLGAVLLLTLALPFLLR